MTYKVICRGRFAPKTITSSLFSVNLVNSSTCTLPNYPGIGSTPGPVVLQFLADQQLLAACGSNSLTDDLSCYQLSPDLPTLTWQFMPAQITRHCPRSYRTRSHYLDYNGWFVFGQDESCSTAQAGIATELFTSSHQWLLTPTVSPYSQSGFPLLACSVPISQTKIMITGGYSGDYLSSSWLLDLTNYSWVALQDMPGPRSRHGCTLTAEGEVLVAGGWNGAPITSVYVYNINSNTWRRKQDLPADMIHTNYPVMFLRNDSPILLESSASRVWRLTLDGWELLTEVKGPSIDGMRDVFCIVPKNLFKCA